MKKLLKLLGYCDICWGLFGTHTKEEHVVHEINEKHKQMYIKALNRRTAEIYTAINMAKLEREVAELG